ncbi:hypothetical protein OIU77_015446, partial [Salix suchowensis]
MPNMRTRLWLLASINLIPGTGHAKGRWKSRSCYLRVFIQAYVQASQLATDSTTDIYDSDA